MLRVKYILFFCVFLACLSYHSSVKAQIDPMWTALGKISYETEMNEDLGAEVMIPIFNNEIKALNGKKVRIRGYVIPLEIGEDYFVISAFPFNACFFCGAAGPETVMEIYLKQEFKISSETVTLEGTLKLNDTDLHHLMYILEGAKPVED